MKERHWVLEMRAIPIHERKKRGCECCTEVIHTKIGSRFRLKCPHTECPHHVLDKYDSYDEFMQSEDAKILVTEFFQTTASCYDLMNENAAVKKVFAKSENNLS